MKHCCYCGVKLPSSIPAMICCRKPCKINYDHRKELNGINLSRKLAKENEK